MMIAGNHNRVASGHYIEKSSAIEIHLTINLIIKKIHTIRLAA